MTQWPEEVLTRYDYRIFPLDFTASLFAARARAKHEGFVADCPHSRAIDDALREGFRWVRTDGELAIFERKTPDEPPQRAKLSAFTRHR